MRINEWIKKRKSSSKTMKKWELHDKRDED